MQYSFSKATLQDFHVIFDSLLLLLASALITGVVVRCIVRIWPIAPGEYDSDSPVFVRWKLVSVLYRLGQGAFAALYVRSDQASGRNPVRGEARG